ncbi:hypothetical protein, conserved [Leishmania tarentolae]|uniref:Uncharacterized protein n=1 Tax=Leishmania tarentolae TaxID=5689 RepID=A0A640KJZ4_LEITA|nr:hypothetical protein, conserved [Leishmania tarentolae]
MIFVEPDVDFFRLHLRDVLVPVPVLQQGPDAIAAASASAPTKETPSSRRSGAAAPAASSSTEPLKAWAGSREHVHRCESGNDDYRSLFVGETASCAKTTPEERADVVHRALLRALHARFPYEAVDTLEYAYVLVVTHHVALPLTSQALNEDDLRCLTSLSALLPDELRYRTFPSHLNAVLDPPPAIAVESTSTNPVSSAPTSGVAANSASVPSGMRPSIRVTDDDAAARAAQEKETAARATAQVLNNVSTTPRFFDSIFLLSRALTPEQQARYHEVQLTGRRPVSCEAAYHTKASAAKVPQGSSANTQMESFSVIDGRFVHCVPADGSVESKWGSTTTLNSGFRRVEGESQSYRVATSERNNDMPAQPAARLLYFSVYRIPLSRFRPAEQEYYADQREELRWRQRHRCRSSYRKLQRKGQPVEKASSVATPTCGWWRHSQRHRGSVDTARGTCGSSCSSGSEDDDEDWEGEVGPTGKAESSLSNAKSQHACYVADGLDQLFCREGHSARYAAEKTSAAEQRSAARFFRTCHEVLTNYALAHSPYATTGAVENEDAGEHSAPSSAHQQHRPRLPFFPRRFAGVSYVGVTRLLYSLAPCDCYHLVMKDHNPFYYAQSSRASYETQTVPLCLVSDLSPETEATASPQRQRGGAGGNGGGVLHLEQLKATPLPPRTRCPGPAVEEQVLLPGRPASGPKTEAQPAAEGAGVAAAGSGREGLVCTPFPSRGPSLERADRTSSQTRLTAASTLHDTSNLPPSSARSRPCIDLVSATDGFLRVSASLLCNNISGSPQARQQSLAEKGVHVPTFLLPDQVLTQGRTDAGTNCGNLHGAASTDGSASASAVNLFKALSQSSLAQQKLRSGSIRSVISVAVLDNSKRVSEDNPISSSGGANSDGTRRYGTLEATQMQLSQYYCCRGLVDHTWLSIPVQRTPAEQDAIQWMPVMLGSTECVSDVGLRTAVHLGIFPRESPPLRGASGDHAGPTAAGVSSPLEPLGAPPTHEGTLPSRKPFHSSSANPIAAPKQTVGSGAATAAHHTSTDVRLSKDKNALSKAMSSVAPLQARPVNCVDDGVTAGIHVGATPPKIQESLLSTNGGEELGRKAVSAPTTTVAQEQSSTRSSVARLEHALTPPAAATSVRIKRGGIALIFDAGSEHQRRQPTGRRSTHSTTMSVPSRSEFPQDCRVAVNRGRCGGSVMTTEGPHEESAEVVSGVSDGDTDDLERRLSPFFERTPARMPRALAWTSPRALVAAEDAENEPHLGGGTTAASKSCSTSSWGPVQAATKTINWADKSFTKRTATRADTHRSGSVHRPSALHTTVEGTAMEEKEQLDANRSVRGRGAGLMPAMYGTATERRAGVFGTSGGNNTYSRISDPLQARRSAPRSNPFLMQTHKMPATKRNQPYQLDAGTPPRPSPLPSGFAAYTSFPSVRGLPQHVSQHQQQTPPPSGRATSVSATSTPTQRFSDAFTPFGQGTGLRHQTTPPAPEQQQQQHHGAGATGFAAAPHSRAPPPTLGLSTSGVSLSSNSGSASVCLPLGQHLSASPPLQECCFDDPFALPRTCERRNLCRGTAITASTAARATANDGDAAPRGAQSAASPSAYFSMAWNKRKTVQGASEHVAQQTQQQQCLSGSVAGFRFSSNRFFSVPQHSTHEHAETAQSRPRNSFYTPPARPITSAERSSFFPSSSAPWRGSGGGCGPAASVVDAYGPRHSLFIDEYDDGAVPASSASHLRGDARAAGRVRPRGVLAMDAAWWKPVRELTSAPNLRYAPTAPVTGHSRSSTSALRLSGADQPYNLPLDSTSNPNGHHSDFCGDYGGCHNDCATTAGNSATPQRSRHSYYHCETSSLNRGTATAPLPSGRAAEAQLPASRYGGLKLDARNTEHENMDNAYVEELSLSPVTPHRTQMRTPFAVRRARRADAITSHGFVPSSCRRPPLAPRSAGGTASRGFSCGHADPNEWGKFRFNDGAATSLSTAAWRNGLSVRERVRLRRSQLDKEKRLADYQAQLQENYLCGSMPKRYCFERQTNEAEADTRSSTLGGRVVRESCVTGSKDQQQSTIGGYAAWTPKTTDVPPAGREASAVLQVGRSARDFSLGLHPSMPLSTAPSDRRDASSLLLRPPTTSASSALGDSGPDVDAARICQAEAHLRQQASKQSQMEARQQMEALADGAVAAQLVTGVNVSFTLRDVANVFLRLPSTSLHVSRTPGTEPCHVSGGAGLDVLDVCDAAWRTEGVSCFLSRKPTQLRGGWASYLERINLYQEPFFLRGQAFVLLLPVPHAPTLKVCVAVHNINDLLALVYQAPVARILPTAEEMWMRKREYGFEDVNDDAEGQQDGAVMVVAERRWFFGLFTTRRLVPAGGARASPSAPQQPLSSSKEDDVARREKCRQLCRQYQVDGLHLTWRHRARLWYALLRAGLNCSALPACTSPLLIDPVACKARCAQLCDRIAAYAVAQHRLETLKALRQSYLEMRAAELSKGRVLKLCDRTHHETARGIQLGGTGFSSSGGTLSSSRCTPSTLLPSVPTRQQQRGLGFGDDGVDSTVRQDRYPAAWGKAYDSTLRMGLHNGFSYTDEAARHSRVARGGDAATLEAPSTAWETPLVAASTAAAPLHRRCFVARGQTIKDRRDERQQREGTPIPPRASVMGGISRARSSLQQLYLSLNKWPPPRTTRSMQLRLAANQRVATGDAPVSSLRHATNASVMRDGRLTSNDDEQCSDVFGLRSHRSFTPPPRPPPTRSSPPQQQKPQPLLGRKLASGGTSTWASNSRDGVADGARKHAHTHCDAVATSCRRSSTLLRPVTSAPDIGSVGVPYDIEAGSHPYASNETRRAMRSARSATLAAAAESHVTGAASHRLFEPVACTLASYASGTSIAPSSNSRITAAAGNGAPCVTPSSAAASSIALSAAAAATELDLILRVDRDDALASMLARLTEHRAASVAPPLVAALSIVPLAAQPVRGAGAGVVEDGDAATVHTSDPTTASPVYPGFIPTPLEVQKRLAQPFNFSIAQVQQLLQWQWEHHQHCYTLMPVPLFAGAAAGPTEADFSLRHWSSQQNVGWMSRDGLNEGASAASPSYAVSPLARELLLHLLRWSWLLPIDYEASRRSGRHRLAATTTTRNLHYLFRCPISLSPLRCLRWRTLALIVVLVTAAEHSSWCLGALLFGGAGYCALNSVAVGFLMRLPSHRGASSRHDRGGWLRCWSRGRGTRSTGEVDVCSKESRRSSSRLVCRPFSALQNSIPPIDDRVSLLYALGESTTQDMLERRRVHFAAQAVLVRVLRLQSTAASLLSRLQLFFYGYSTALSLWVALLFLAYALLYVVYLEAARAVQRSAGGAMWSADCDGSARAGALSVFWQVTRRILHTLWWGANAASTASFDSRQSAASASTGAATPPLEPLQNFSQAAWQEILESARYILLQRLRGVVDGGDEAAAAGVVSAVKSQLFGDNNPAAAATERTGGSVRREAIHGHHGSSSYFYQNGKYYAYDAEPPAWAKAESASAANWSSVGGTLGPRYERVPTQPQRQQPSPSARVVQSLSEWFSHILQDSASDGKGGRGHYQKSVLSNHSAGTVSQNSTYITSNSSAPYVCPNKAAGSSVAEPSMFWFLVVAYVVTISLSWSPYRWLWRRVWTVLIHDDALARRPLLTV